MFQNHVLIVPFLLKIERKTSCFGTKMSALREKESEILTSLSNSPKSLSELAEELGAGFSKTTVHRIVTSLAKDGRIVASGSGRSAKYEITSVGRLFNPITPEEYFRKEQDDRQALTSFISGTPTIVKQFRSSLSSVLRSKTLFHSFLIV